MFCIINVYFLHLIIFSIKLQTCYPSKSIQKNYEHFFLLKIKVATEYNLILDLSNKSRRYIAIFCYISRNVLKFILDEYETCISFTLELPGKEINIYERE